MLVLDRNSWNHIIQCKLVIIYLLNAMDTCFKSAVCVHVSLY